MDTRISFTLTSYSMYSRSRSFVYKYIHCLAHPYKKAIVQEREHMTPLFKMHVVVVVDQLCAIVNIDRLE